MRQRREGRGRKADPGGGGGGGGGGEGGRGGGHVPLEVRRRAHSLLNAARDTLWLSWRLVSVSVNHELEIKWVSIA